MPNETNREAKIATLCETIKENSDAQADLDKLVALSMKTGYELGKQTQQ